MDLYDDILHKVFFERVFHSIKDFEFSSFNVYFYQIDWFVDNAIESFQSYFYPIGPLVCSRRPSPPFPRSIIELVHQCVTAASSGIEIQSCRPIELAQGSFHYANIPPKVQFLMPTKSIR